MYKYRRCVFVVFGALATLTPSQPKELIRPSLLVIPSCLTRGLWNAVAYTQASFPHSIKGRQQSRPECMIIMRVRYLIIFIYFFLLLTAGPSVSRAIKCATNGVVLLPNILRCSSGWRDTYIYLSVCLSVPGWTIPWQETFFFLWIGVAMGSVVVVLLLLIQLKETGETYIFLPTSVLWQTFLFFFSKFLMTRRIIVCLYVTWVGSF